MRVFVCFLAACTPATVTPAPEQAQRSAGLSAVTGPTGPTGEAGPVGAPGEAGATGMTGATGATGEPGLPGTGCSLTTPPIYDVSYRCLGYTLTCGVTSAFICTAQPKLEVVQVIAPDAPDCPGTGGTRILSCYDTSPTPPDGQCDATDAEFSTVVSCEATYSVRLDSYNASLLAVTKAIKDLTGLGLAEAKALAESAPVIIKAHVPLAEAQAIELGLENAGGTATVISDW